MQAIIQAFFSTSPIKLKDQKTQIFLENVLLDRRLQIKHPLEDGFRKKDNKLFIHKSFSQISEGFLAKIARLAKNGKIQGKHSKLTG